MAPTREAAARRGSSRAWARKRNPRDPAAHLGLARMQLALGGFGAALSVHLMAQDMLLGSLAAIVAFTLIGAGVGAAGTSLLVLLSSQVAEARRPAAATIVWIMMIAGFIVTAATAGHFLDPFSTERLMVVAACICAGAFLLTLVAVRGLETKGGRISAVVTEKGAIACDTVVLAGGAWSRRFCHNLGIALPQLTVINSVMRTEPIDTGLTRTCSGGGFTFRKRMDGGYTVTDNHFSVADIVPDSFRLFREFLPALRLDWSGLRRRLGKRFIEEARLKRRWALDEVSPFEQVRILAKSAGILR